MTSFLVQRGNSRTCLPRAHKFLSPQMGTVSLRFLLGIFSCYPWPMYLFCNSPLPQSSLYTPCTTTCYLPGHSRSIYMQILLLNKGTTSRKSARGATPVSALLLAQRQATLREQASSRCRQSVSNNCLI
eukprot:jgi/Picsp_1/4959/NSC_02322-R1_---NA---